jgi:hypothetical protein
MHQDEALAMVQEFLEAHGLDGSGADSAKDAAEAEAAAWQPEIAFQVDVERGELKCWALIFQFDRPLSDGFLAACHEEAGRGADTGGGAVEFDPEDRGLYLTRSYTSRIGVARLGADLQRLQKASEAWGEEVLDRVYDRVPARFAPTLDMFDM